MNRSLPLALGTLLTLSACQGTVPAPTASSVPASSPAAVSSTPVPSTPIPATTTPSTPSSMVLDADGDELVPMSTTPTSETPTASTMPAGDAASKPLTMAEVAAHATPEDCWIVIRGTVYDVSGFGAKHPGGDSVYRDCGKDATVNFDTRPNGPGTPHPEKANELLPEFAIGVIAQ